MASKPHANAPISRHPLFPTAVALWFAALLGLGSIAIRASVLERLVLAVHLDLVIPAAAPPLGFTARMLLALILAGGGALAGFFIARRVAGNGPSGGRVRAPARPTVIVPTAGKSVVDDEDEDLARLEAARQSEPRRRRPLALAEETLPAELHDYAPLPGGRPTILNIGELDPIPSLGNAVEQPQAAPAVVAPLATMATAANEPAITVAEEPIPAPEPCPAAVSGTETQPVVVAKRQGAPVLAPLPLAASAPVDGTAAARLRESPLEMLGVVELVERFALALEGRRQRASADVVDAKPSSSVDLPEFSPNFSEQAPHRAEAPVPDPASRPFDIPAALRTPGLDEAGPSGWTSGWFATAPEAVAQHEKAPQSDTALTAGQLEINAGASGEEEFDEADAADDGFSSLLDLKPSIRNANSEPVLPHKGPHIPGAIVPGAAFGNSPAETEQALREALTALQRMSGAA